MPLSKIPGLVLHLPMNEQSGSTAFDNTRYSNDGSLGGGDADKMPVWSEHGLRFDGADDYIDCGNDASLDITDAITISVWVKSTKNNVYQGIVTKLHSVVKGYGIRKMGSDNKICFMIGNGATWIPINSDIAYTDTNWHHIVAIYDGTNMYMYVDGVLQIETGTATIVDSANICMIGKLYSNVNDYYHSGSIDDPRIYNRALSAAEITDLYNERRHLYV